MKQRRDGYGSLSNVQNGHLLLPVTCVLSILDLRILNQFSPIPGTSLVGRRNLESIFLIETSERHTATDLVNFVYYPTGFL